MSTLEPGSCLDEGIGQDPVDFLMNEIARIENQLICETDNDRIFGPALINRYLPMDGSSLVLQVFYSEPTMVENLSGDDITDRLYFKGIIGGTTTYNSIRFGYFERLPSNFQLPLTKDNSSSSSIGSNNVDFDDSFVVHYLFNGALPQQYVGNIQLFLGGSDLGSDEGPRDLAGNQMDSDPGTTSQPRNNYGPFSYIGFETGPDINHAWEPPNWYHNTSTDIVSGFVGIEQDFVASVNLNTIGLADCQFLGDCDYWCGFWLFRQISSTNSYAYIVKPDGSYLQFHLSIPGIGATDISVHPEYVIGDGRYCWLTGNFGGAPDFSRSGTNAFRVDAEEEYVYSKNVCTGASWESGSTIYLSIALFIEQYPNGQAQYHYSYCTVPWGPPFSGYVILPPSSTNSNDVTLISNDIEIDVEADDVPIVEIQGNPISSNLGIICNSSVSQEYELVIYDIAGRRVLVDTGILESTDSRVNIGVSNIPSGVYLVRIRTGDIEVMRTISIIH